MKTKGFPVWTLFLLPGFFGSLAADEPLSYTLPFRLHGGHMIVVSARIGTLSGLNLLLDTGASRTVLDRSVAEKLGLKGEERKVVAYGKTQTVREVRIPTLTLGDLSFFDIAVQVAPVAFRGLDQQIRIDGLIGLDLMRRTSLSIDFEACLISFGPIVHSESSFPFYGRLPIIPVSLEIGGERVKLLLDTGAENLILYQRRTEGRVPMQKTGERIEIRCLGRKASLKQVQLREVSLGPSQWEHFEAYLLDVRCPESGPDGVLGVGSLGLKKLNLDFQNNVVSWLR